MRPKFARVAPDTRALKHLDSREQRLALLTIAKRARGEALNEYRLIVLGAVNYCRAVHGPCADV